MALMLERLKSLKAEFLSLIWLKLAVIVLGYFFALINQFVPPAELAPLPDETTPFRDSSIRIGGFVLITAIALFTSLIPTGKEPRDILVDYVARLLGVLAAFGAGWYTIDVATQGNPGLYLYGATTLTGLTIAFLLVGAGIWAGIILLVRAFAEGLDAAILCLRTIAKCAIRFLARRLHGRWDTDD